MAPQYPPEASEARRRAVRLSANAVPAPRARFALRPHAPLLQSLILSVVTTIEDCIPRTQFNELGGLLLQARPRARRRSLGPCGCCRVPRCPHGTASACALCFGCASARHAYGPHGAGGGAEPAEGAFYLSSIYLSIYLSIDR